MNQFRVILMPVLLAVLFALAPAKGQGIQDSVRKLGELVVVGKPFKTVIPSQTLSGLELKTLNSYSVADALRYFSGVKLKDYGGMGGLKTIDVRNMGTNHVGVFYNGTAVGNAQNGIVDLGKFSLDDVEEVSLYNGQKSDIFQSAKDFASASSIYIRTKRASFKGDKKTNLTLRYKTGTIENYNPSVRLEQKLSERVMLTLSSEFMKSPGRYKFRLKRVHQETGQGYDTTGYRRNSDIRMNRVEANVFAYISDYSLLETNIYYYNSQRGLPGAIIRSANGFQQSNNERVGDSDFFVQTSYTNTISQKYKLMAKAKFAHSRTHYTSLDTVRFFDQTAGWGNMMYDNRYYQQQLYTSFVNQYKISSIWDVAMAVDFEYTRLNASFGNRLGPETVVDGEAFAYPRRYALIAALSSTLDMGKFKALFSLQGSYVKEQTSGVAKPNQRPVVAAPNKRKLTPAIFLGYRPFKSQELSFRLFYKQIFRMPTFNDLYYAQIGTSTLKPESVDQVNFGFTYNIPINEGFLNEITIQSDAYYTESKDKIIASPTGSSFRWMMSNIGKVKTRGVEAMVRLKGSIGEFKITASGNYSYTSARDYEDRNLTSYGNQLPYTPWHTASAIVNMQYRGWALNYSFIYVGKRYNGAFNNIPVNRVNPWYTHDISLRKDLTLGRVNTTLSVEANNLFDQYYEVVLNYPLPGRNFRFSISVDI